MACAGAVCMNVGVTVIAWPLECSGLFYWIVVLYVLIPKVITCNITWNELII